VPAYAASPVKNTRQPQGAHLPPCVLIVDANNTAKAAYHVSGELVTDAGHGVGITYTMLNSLKTLLYHFPTATQVIYCWDSRPIWRSALYPAYKMNRASHQPGHVKDPEDNWEEQKQLFLRFLEVLPVTQVRGELLEADDIAYWLSRKEQLPEGHVAVLVSNDKDWFQLIGDHQVLWRPSSVIPKKFLDLHNYDRDTDYRTPAEIIQVKAIAGDSKDNVHGADGIGEGSVLKYLNHQPMQEFREKRILDWIDTEHYRLNLRLLDLDQTPKELFHNIEVNRTLWDERAFMMLCRELEFYTIMERWGEFTGAFLRLAR